MKFILLKVHLSFPYFLVTFLFLSLNSLNVFAQNNRFDVLEQKLVLLAQKDAPGLLEEITISLSGVTIQEYLRVLARANSLNISIDPDLKIIVSNSFEEEKAINVLLFLAKEHNLDIEFIGSIMSIKKYVPPPNTPTIAVKKEINMQYDSNKALLSFDLNNDTLIHVTKKITQLTNKNISLVPGISNQRVTAYALNMPVEKALEKLAFENTLKVNNDNKDLFLLEKEEVIEDENKDVKTNANNARNTRNSRNQNPTTGGLNIGINKGNGNKTFLNVDAVNIPIAEIIKSVSQEANINHYLFEEPPGSVSIFVEGIEYEAFLTYLLQGTSFTFTKQDDLYLIGARKAEGFRSTRLFQLQYRAADTIVALIPTEIKKEAELNIFPELNSIIASGSSLALDEIEVFIKAIDQIVPMVLIEVIVMDINKSRLVEAGFSLGIGSEPTTTQGSIFPETNLSLSSSSVNDIIGAINGSGLVNLGFVNPNVFATLKLLEDQQFLSIKSTPNLATLNGHAASMRIGQTRYYRQSQSNIIGVQNPQTIVTEEFREANADLSINIRPVVSGDEHVTLNIQVELSTFLGIPPENAPPPTATRFFDSMIRVKNQQTVVLGGLSEVEKSENNRGIPILSRIPIIKWLFSNKTKNRRKSELAVLIKPTIIY